MAPGPRPAQLRNAGTVRVATVRVATVRVVTVRVATVRAPRTPTYGPVVVSALEQGWQVASCPAGTRLAPMLAVLVPMFRRDGEVELSDEQAVLLEGMSASTIDRRLQGAKVLAGLSGRSHTKPGTLLKDQIPIWTWSEWDDGAGVRRDRPGRPRGREQLRRVLFHAHDD